MKRILLIITLLAACAAGPACTPKLYAPDLEIPEAYLGEASQEEFPYVLAWWRTFDDPQLDTLIRRALRRNRNLEQAVSRLEAARYSLAVSRAAYLPEISGEVVAGADYTAEERIVQNYAVRPALSWEVSLFGALRNSQQAARAEILSTEWALRGVMLALTAEVATTYFTLRQYEQDLDIARVNLKLRRESAALIDSMFRYGMSDGVALEQARSLIYTAEADIASYCRSVVDTRLTLGTLLGEAPQPADTVTVGAPPPFGPLPGDVPAGIPSDLLHRRPDIMEDFYNMEQAAARVGLARSERFPSISLTSGGGVASSSLRRLTSGNPWVWSVAASLVQPLFSFGKLRRSEQIARETYRQNMLAYEESVLEALEEVEQTLNAIETYRAQTETTARLVESYARVAEMAQALYRSGMSDYLNVIDAERNSYQAQMQYVNLTTRQRINYVDLFKALGGGW